MRIIEASGHNIRESLAHIRSSGVELPQYLNFRKGYPLISGGEDGCYRISFEDDMVVELTVIPFSEPIIHGDYTQ